MVHVHVHVCTCTCEGIVHVHVHVCTCAGTLALAAGVQPRRGNSSRLIAAGKLRRYSCLLCVLPIYPVAV